jgi:hypothetical protein
MLTCPDDQIAVPSPSKTQAGVKITKGRRIGPKRYFRSFMVVTPATHLGSLMHFEENPSM